MKNKSTLIVIAILLIATSSYAALSLMPPAKTQIFDNNGKPCVGCTLSFYYTGTTTPKAAYTSAAGTSSFTVKTLDSSGRAEIWLDGSYKVVLKSASGSTVWTVDGVSSMASFVPDPVSIWQSSNVLATFLSVTSFSVTGDYTHIYQVGRRIKTSSGGVDVYGRIDTSCFNSCVYGKTVVSVILDSGSLAPTGYAVDVNYSILPVLDSAISVDMLTSGTFTGTIGGDHILPGKQTISGDILSSGVNTLSGKQYISGDIESSGSNTFSGKQIVSGDVESSGTHTFSDKPITFINSQVTISGGTVQSNAVSTLTNTQNISGDINSSGTNSFAGVQTFRGGIVSTQTLTHTGGLPVYTRTTGTTMQASDCGSTQIFNLTSNVTYTLLSASTGSIPVGCIVLSKNTSTFTLTLSGVVDDIINPTIAQNGSLQIFSSGTSWKFLSTGYGQFASTIYSLITTSGTWTVPAGISAIKISAQAGGGGGAGAGKSGGDCVSGGGGGMGGVLYGYYLSVTPYSTLTISIGYGGAGGSGGGYGGPSNGNNGSSTLISYSSYPLFTLTGGNAANYSTGGNTGLISFPTPTIHTGTSAQNYYWLSRYWGGPYFSDTAVKSGSDGGATGPSHVYGGNGGGFGGATGSSDNAANAISGYGGGGGGGGCTNDEASHYVGYSGSSGGSGWVLIQYGSGI